MCSPEEEALLRLEEVFSATLARINSLVLQPLLETSESWLCRGEGRGVGVDTGTILGIESYLVRPGVQLSQPQTGGLTLGIGIF